MDAPDLSFALVTRELLEKFQDFSCGSEEWNTDLNEFLPEYALDDLQQRRNSTYLFFDPDECAVAYVVVANQELRFDRNSWLETFFTRNKYGGIPALFIGRIAVSQSYQNMRIGSTILALVRRWAEESMVPHRVIVLEVDERNEGAKRLYERGGFTHVFTRKGGRMLMMSDLGSRRGGVRVV